MLEYKTFEEIGFEFSQNRDFERMQSLIHEIEQKKLGEYEGPYQFDFVESEISGDPDLEEHSDDHEYDLR